MNLRPVLLTLMLGASLQPAFAAPAVFNTSELKPFQLAQVSLEQQAEAALKASRWQDVQKLAEQMIQKQPNKAPGYVLRGRALANLGQFDLADADFKKALSLNPKSAGALAGMAHVHLAKRELDQALPLLDQAISLDGKNPGYYFNRGMAKMLRHGHAAAIGDLDQALKLDANNPEYYAVRALSHYSLRNLPASQQDLNTLFKLKAVPQETLIRANNLQGRLHLESGKYPQALAIFQSNLKLQPKSTETLVNLGMLHLAQGKRDLAIKAFNDSLAAAPNELAYNRLGLLAFEDARYEQAIEYFTQALDVSTQSSQYVMLVSRADLFNRRGQTYLQINQPAKALADHDAAIKAEPDLARSYNYRALVKMSQQNVDGALSDLNLALSKDSRYADAFRNRAQVWRQRGKQDAALADQTKLIALLPKEAAPLVERAQTFFAMRDAEAALADLKAALALDPQFIPGYITRAELLLALNQPAEAMKDANRVTELDKKNVWGYIYRAEALISQKQFDAALKEYATIAKLEPGNPAVNYHRGRIHVMKGDYTAAEADLKLALEQDPSFAPAWYFLGLASDGLQNSSQARSAMGKACELGLPVACEALRTNP